MNIRQTLLAATVAVGLLPFAAGGIRAQTPQPPATGPAAPNPNAERRATARMRALERLDLTAEQKAKIQSLTERFRTDAQALRSLDSQQRRTRMREMSTKLRSDIEAVLTPEQRAKLQEERRQRGRGERAGRFGRMMHGLNLTPQQKAQIDPILRDAAQQMAKVRDDQTLDRGVRAQKVRSIQQEAMTRIRPLLTPEQRQKLDQTGQPRQGGGVRGGSSTL